MNTLNKKQQNCAKGLWDEKSKKWIRPSGTVKQGRRPMFKPSEKAPSFPTRYDANGDLRKAQGKPELPCGHNVMTANMQAGGEMNKVFIPDNEGGGTWEAWKDDRPNYKAHAEALAEALERAHHVFENDTSRKQEVMEQIEKALANWEGAK